MNTQRNRWLLAALGLVVVFYFGEMGYRKLYEEPAKKNERLKEQLSERLKTAKLDLAKSKRVMDQLETLEQKSLPWDEEMARERYRDWLLQLADDARLVNLSVDSGDPVSVKQSNRKTRRSKEIYKKFTFSVHGRGDLGQVTRFLYEFYRGGHLHKIRSMSWNPVGQGQQVDLSLSIEALALANADREADLTSLVSDELAQENIRDYSLIARRNFFGQGGTQSAWSQVKLTAVTFDVRGIGEAWIKVGSERQTRFLQVGQALSMPAFEVQFVKLADTGATVSIDGQTLQLMIGQSLADAVPVDTPLTPE